MVRWSQAYCAQSSAVDLVRVLSNALDSENMRCMRGEGKDEVWVVMLGFN